MAETDRRVQVLANARCLYGRDIEVITFSYPSKRTGKGVDYQAAVMKRQNYPSAWVNILYSDPPAPTRKKAMQLLLKKTEDELVNQLTQKGVSFPLMGDVAGFEVSKPGSEDVVSVSEGSEISDFEFIATPASSSAGDFVDDGVFDDDGIAKDLGAELKSEPLESQTAEEVVSKSPLDAVAKDVVATDVIIPTENASHKHLDAINTFPDLPVEDDNWKGFEGWTSRKAKKERNTTDNVLAKEAQHLQPGEFSKTATSLAFDDWGWNVSTAQSNKKKKAAQKNFTTAEAGNSLAIDPWAVLFDDIKNQAKKTKRTGEKTTISGDLAPSEPTVEPTISSYELSPAVLEPTEMAVNPKLIPEDPFKSLDSWGVWYIPVESKDAPQASFNFRNKGSTDQIDGLALISPPKSKRNSHETPKISPEAGLDDAYDWSQWEGLKEKKKKTKKFLKGDVSIWQLPAIYSDPKSSEATSDNAWAKLKRSNALEPGPSEQDDQGEKFYEASEHHVESEKFLEPKSDAVKDPWIMGTATTKYNKKLTNIDNHQDTEIKSNASFSPYLEAQIRFPALKTISEQYPSASSDKWEFNLSKNKEGNQKSKLVGLEFHENSPASLPEPTTNEFDVKASLADDDFGWNPFSTKKGKGKGRSFVSSPPISEFTLREGGEDKVEPDSSRNGSGFSSFVVKKDRKSEQATPSNEEFELKPFAVGNMTDVNKDDAAVSELSTVIKPASAPVLAKAQVKHRMNVLGEIFNDQVSPLESGPDEFESRIPRFSKAQNRSLERVAPSFFVNATLPPEPSIRANNVCQTRLILLNMQHHTPIGNQTFRLMFTISSSLKRAVTDEASRYMDVLSPLTSPGFDRKIEIMSAVSRDGDVDLAMMDEGSWEEILAYLSRDGRIVELVVKVEDIEDIENW